ncbi:hypothetical protein [Streptomyces cathayae]|uniref:hypothetical protein n=1 Tax=Streptomyces cathayae TaxID=3031124 RepID=UPI003C6F686A
MCRGGRGRARPHGPGAREDLEPIVGKVVGFVLTGDGLPTVYVSGDSAQLGLVQEIADRFGPVDTAVHFDSRAHFTRAATNCWAPSPPPD